MGEGKAKMAGRKRWRILWFSGGVALILIVFSAITFQIILPWFIERYILAELRSAGIEHADLDVRLIGWNHALFTNLRVGEESDLRIAEVIAEYSLPDLFRGRLERITLSGLRMHIHVGASGVSFGALDDLLKSTQEGRTVPPVLPAAVIEMRASQLDVTTPFGPSTVSISAKLHMADSGGLKVAAELGLQNSNASLSTKAVLRMEPDGRVEGRIQISRGALSLTALGAPTISGEFTFKSFGYEMERLQGWISFGELKLPLASFRKTRLEFELEGNCLTAKGVMVSSDNQAKIEFTTKVDNIYASAPSITLRGLAEAREASTLHQAFPLPHSIKGRGQLSIILKGTLPNLKQLTALREWPEKLDALALNGTVDLNLTEVSLPRFVAGLSVAGRLKVDISGNLLTVGSAKGIHLKAERLDPALFEKWPKASELRRNLKGPLSLWIGGGKHKPFILQARAVGNSIALRLAGRTVLTFVDGARLKSEINGTAELYHNGKIKRFDIAHLAISLANWRQATATVKVNVNDLHLAGTPETFSGKYNAELFAGNVQASKLTIQEVYLALAGDVAFRQKRFSLKPEMGSLARVTGARWEGSLIVAGPLNLTIDPAVRPLFELDFGKAEGLFLRHLVALTPSPASVEVLRPRGHRLPILVKLPSIRWAGKLFWPRGDYQGTVAATGAALEVPSLAIALRGADVKLHLSASPREDGTFASLKVSQILHLEDPPYVKPLRLKAEIDRREGRLLFSGQIKESSGMLVFDFDGAQDLNGRDGNVNIKLHPLRFIPRMMEPQDLFPALRGAITSALGQVALEGKIHWEGQKLTSNLKLLIKELSLQTQRLTLNQINSVILFDGLRPLSTPSGQLVTVSMMDIGLPLTDGIISFHLDPDGRLLIERAEWRLAGGKLSAEGVSTDPKRGCYKFVLEVEDIDLQKLAALAKVEGLTVTGKLTGRIPVQIKEGVLTVREGLIKGGPEGGTLRYNPSRVPSALRHSGERTRLMLSALKNFRYKTLRIKLDRRSDGNASVNFHLSGSNPDFFKGHPVEFNLNLSGRLDEILQRGLKVYQIPETIIRQLQKSSR